MKMPHIDDHPVRSSQSPHQHHEERTPGQLSYYYDKRTSEAELSPHGTAGRQEAAYSPHHWRHPQQHPHPHHSPMDHSTGSSHSDFHDHGSTSTMSTPPSSPRVPPRYDYSSYEGHRHHHQQRSVAPYSQHGGYSYYHHHPNSRPPMMPRELHHHHPYHHQYHPPHPVDTVSGPPPPPPQHYSSYPHPHHMPPPRYETPPLTSSSASSTSYYHDQQYPNFLPPSAGIPSTASSPASLIPRDGEEEYPYGDSHSTQGSSAQEEVNQVGPNDVLCGRGAPTNYHPGNEYFRDLVKQYQSNYLASKRADKPFVASHIVNIIQSRGGRFLRRYKRNGVSWERGHFVWVEVEPQKAYEKACQALREGAPEIRRKMQESCSSDGEEDAVVVVGADNNLKAAPPSSKTAAAKGERTEQPDQKATPGGEGNKNDPQVAGQKSDGAEAAEEPSDDDRNDDMQGSERS